jgi:hypothetical protein
MDYLTAHRLLLEQGLDSAKFPDALLTRLAAKQPPIPGQVTSVLLALKVTYEALRGQASLDRQLVASLHYLAQETRARYESGVAQGIDWPPLLREDLHRIAKAVRHIFGDRWDD